MELIDGLHISETITVKARHYFSIQHIQSAALFTRQCHQIEKQYDGTFSDELIAEHRSYVTGAIFAAVSFLEATINEVFADTLDHPDGELASHLDIATKQLMADLWRLEIPRTSRFKTLEKFQIALTLARKPLFNPSNAVYEDIQTLITIRNELIHFEPVWTSVEAEKAKRRILSLQEKKKFSLNPLITAAANPFYPDKCLGHGCARWAVTTSTQFVENFYARMGIPVLFDHVKSRLKIES